MSRIVLSALCVLSLQGCDLFQTREPQAPTQSGSARTPPDTPEIVLDNLRSSVQQHSTDNYMRCFVDTTVSGAPPFTFSASGDFQGIFRNWTLEDERRYFLNLGAPVNGSPLLTFLNQQQLNQGASATEYTMDYILFYPHSQPALPKEFRGYMHLFMQTDGQHGWSITRWEDTRTVTDSTWSYLKAHF